MIWALVGEARPDRPLVTRRDMLDAAEFVRRFDVDQELTHDLAQAIADGRRPTEKEAIMAKKRKQEREKYKNPKTPPVSPRTGPASPPSPEPRVEPPGVPPQPEPTPVPPRDNLVP
jgi:hypothetical protein